MLATLTAAVGGSARAADAAVRSMSGRAWPRREKCALASFADRAKRYARSAPTKPSAAADRRFQVVNQATESGASIPSSAATEEAPANASESRDRASAPNAPAPDAARSDASRDAARASLDAFEAAAARRSNSDATSTLASSIARRVLLSASSSAERLASASARRRAANAANGSPRGREVIVERVRERRARDARDAQGNARRRAPDVLDRGAHRVRHRLHARRDRSDDGVRFSHDVEVDPRVERRE